MTPFRFGPPHAQLYGIHHRAESGRAPVGAVLLCNPFGQEAIRTHRMFRVLAERLARSGIHAMRFDYFGTGDAAGDDTDGDLDIWRDDVLRAHQELCKRAPGVPVTWLGVRLGATLAALAAEHAPAAADRLVLWEPIAHGCAYLDELAGHHEHALEKSYSLVPKRFRAAPADEAIGFGMGPRLVAQLRALNPARLAGLKARHATLITGTSTGDVSAYAEAYRHTGSPTEQHVFEHVFDWASEEAINTALVPQEALQLLQSLVNPVTP